MDSAVRGLANILDRGPAELHLDRLHVHRVGPAESRFHLDPPVDAHCIRYDRNIREIGLRRIAGVRHGGRILTKDVSAAKVLRGGACARNLAEVVGRLKKVATVVTGSRADVRRAYAPVLTGDA